GAGRNGQGHGDIGRGVDQVAGAGCASAGSGAGCAETLVEGNVLAALAAGVGDLGLVGQHVSRTDPVGAVGGGVGLGLLDRRLQRFHQLGCAVDALRGGRDGLDAVGDAVEQAGQLAGTVVQAGSGEEVD